MKRKNLDRDQRVWEEINMSYYFLLDLALILLSTKILGLIAQKFQMPQVVGALIAGLILSPAGPLAFFRKRSSPSSSASLVSSC